MRGIGSCALAAAILSCCPLALAQERSVYTATSGPQCRDASRAQFGRWSCPGPGGFEVAFFDERNLVAVALRRSGHSPYRAVTATWPGAGKVFGERIEWLMGERQVPHAAIIRTWEIGEDERTKEAVRIFAIDAQGSCEFTTIDARRPFANEEARRGAELALRERCPNR